MTNLTNPTMRLSHIQQCIPFEQKCAYICSKVSLWDLWDRSVRHGWAITDHRKLNAVITYPCRSLHLPVFQERVTQGTEREKTRQKPNRKWWKKWIDRSPGKIKHFNDVT